MVTLQLKSISVGYAEWLSTWHVNIIQETLGECTMPHLYVQSVNIVF